MFNPREGGQMKSNLYNSFLICVLSMVQFRGRCSNRLERADRRGVTNPIWQLESSFSRPDGGGGGGGGDESATD